MRPKLILSDEEMKRALVRIAHEVLEKNKGAKNLAIVGIRTGGAILAEKLVNTIKQIEGETPPLGILDITLYRDDLSEIGPQPEVHGTEIDFEIDRKKIILVDDVLFTGRTIRCALDQLVDFGRPLAIQLAVLIDRGHRELPIKADYIGKNIPTAINEEVVVRFAINGFDKEEVVIVKRKKNEKK